MYNGIIVLELFYLCYFRLWFCCCSIFVVVWLVVVKEYLYGGVDVVIKLAIFDCLKEGWKEV